MKRLIIEKIRNKIVVMEIEKFEGKRQEKLFVLLGNMDASRKK